MLKGVFNKRFLLDLVKDLIVFGEADGSVRKVLAGYHQFHTMRHDAARSPRRVGVIWHTQGSGRGCLVLPSAEHRY